MVLISTFSAIILALPNYLSRFFDRGASLAVFPFWVVLQQVPLIYGIIPSILFILGFYLFASRGKAEEHSIIAAIVVLVIIVLVFTQTKVSYLIPYQRILVPLMMLMSILAAFGLSEISKKFKFRYFIPAILAIILKVALRELDGLQPMP